MGEVGFVIDGLIDIGPHTRIAPFVTLGLRTGDIMSDGCKQITTAEMGDAILASFKALSA